MMLGDRINKCLIDILALLLDRPMVFSFLTRDTRFWDFFFLFFFFWFHFFSSIRRGDSDLSLRASIAREPSSSSQKSKAIFLQRATMMFTKSDEMRGKEKREEGKQETRREEFRNGMIRSAASIDQRQSLDEAKNSRFFFFSIRYSLLPFFCHSLFFLFLILLHNVQITLLVLLLTWPNLPTAGDFDFSNDRTLRGKARNIDY